MNWIKLVLMGVSIMLITTGCERTTVRRRFFEISSTEY